MRFLIGGFLLAHGFAHLVGLAGAWQLGAGVPHKTTLLAGRIDLGEAGIRAFGVVWSIAAIAFGAAASALFTVQPAWTNLALAATVFSLLITLLALPESRIGVWIDVGLLGLLYLTARFDWLAGGPR